jgi:DNA end-binding protein Ku
MAVQLIESLSEPFDPGRFEDTHRNAVLELVERKAAGETDLVVAPAAAATDTVVDLMAALEASVREAKEARRRHPTARTAPGEATGGEEPAATPRKRAPRRKSA